MTRRGTPPIHPDDLRDHADEDRIDRIWERIDADIAVQTAATSGARRSRSALVFAVAAAFAAGIGLGKAVWQPRASSQPTTVVRPPEEQAALDVLAAGTHGRTFGLPGGARVALSPGGTAEILRNPDGTVALRLVQGEAQVDTGADAQPLSVVAGDAMLSVQTGSVMHVRRGSEDLDVSVSDGSVQLVSPAGTRHLSRGERADAIPVRAPVAASTASSQRPGPLAAARRDRSPNDSVRAPSVATERHGRPEAVDPAETLQVIRRHPGGIDGAIAGARSAQELMEIHDALRSAADLAGAMRALERILASFPNSEYAQIAAWQLGAAYQRAGNAAKANEYFERARSFKGALAEDALCRQLKSATNKDDAVRIAQEYLQSYPDGRCKDDAERVAGGDFTTPDDDVSADAGPRDP